MIGINVTVKLKNKLAKNSIMMSLKSISEHLFSETGGLLLKSLHIYQILRLIYFSCGKIEHFKKKQENHFPHNFGKTLKIWVELSHFQKVNVNLNCQTL